MSDTPETSVTGEIMVPLEDLREFEERLKNCAAERDAAINALREAMKYCNHWVKSDHWLEIANIIQRSNQVAEPHEWQRWMEIVERGKKC